MLRGCRTKPQFDGPKSSGKKPVGTHEWDAKIFTSTIRPRYTFLFTWLEANLADAKVAAAGHRIVLGGTRFEGAVRIEGDVLDYLQLPDENGALASAL